MSIDRTTRVAALAVLTAIAIAGAIAPGPSAFAGGGATPNSFRSVMSWTSGVSRLLR